jgi:hypothetical protein
MALACSLRLLNNLFSESQLGDLLSEVNRARLQPTSATKSTPNGHAEVVAVLPFLAAVERTSGSYVAMSESEFARQVR